PRRQSWRIRSPVPGDSIPISSHSRHGTTSSVCEGRPARLSYSVAVFQADVRDALVPYELAAPRFYYRNAGSTRHRGVELSTDFALSTGVNLAAVWTYAVYRFLCYSFTTGTTMHTLVGRALPGVLDQWMHSHVSAHESHIRVVS